MCRPILELHLVDIQSDADDGNVHHVGLDSAVDENASQFVVLEKDVIWPFDAELFGGQNGVQHFNDAQWHCLGQQKLPFGWQKTQIHG